MMRLFEKHIFAVFILFVHRYPKKTDIFKNVT